MADPVTQMSGSLNVGGKTWLKAGMAFGLVLLGVDVVRWAAGMGKTLIGSGIKVVKDTTGPPASTATTADSKGWAILPFLPLGAAGPDAALVGLLALALFGLVAGLAYALRGSFIVKAMGALLHMAVALEEPGVLKIYGEKPSGDRRIILDTIRTGLMSATIANGRPRLDVPLDMNAQKLDPTPPGTRSTKTLARVWIPQGGWLVVAHKSDAADTLDTSDCTFNVQVIMRDMTIAEGAPGDYRTKQLSVADPTVDTDRVAADPILSTTGFVELIAWQVPSSQEWLMHGDHEIIVMDDTA